MKIIDLLNKIANGEEVPKYVQYYNMLKDKIDIMMVCKENIFYKLDQLEIQLNSRVEPVEKEKKIPEKLETYKEVDDEDYFANTLKVSKIGECEIDEATSVIVDKINEIIDCLDYLKNKGE